jgi:YVTN family beta-propeller protein
MKAACTSRIAFLNSRVLIGFALYAAGLVLALAVTSSAAAEDNAAAELSQSAPAQAPATADNLLNHVAPQGAKPAQPRSVAPQQASGIDCDNAPGIVIHDDGTVEQRYSAPATVTKVIFADKFTPTNYPNSYTDVCLDFVTLAGGPETWPIDIVVYADDGPDGSPGTLLGTLPNLTATTHIFSPDHELPIWNSYDISSLGLNVTSGSVYIGAQWAPTGPPNVYLSDDINSLIFGGGYWWNNADQVWVPIQNSFSDYRSMLIRAVQAVPGPTPTPTPTPCGVLAYISEFVSNDVKVIDTTTNTVLTSVELGSNPYGVAVNPAGTRVYVTISGENDVAVIDTATHTVLTTVPVRSTPIGVAVNPARPRLYVTNDHRNSVSVIDTDTNTVLTTVDVGEFPFGVAVNPAGTRLYVASEGSDNVSVIDTDTNTVLTTVPVGFFPSGAAVNPAGTRLYTTNYTSHDVSVIDTDTNTVVATVAVGTNPIGAAVNPAGTRLYVANEGSDSVSVIDTDTNTVLTTVPVGSTPEGVAVTPDGTHLYVANWYDENVSVIDTSTNTVVATVAVAITPAAFGNFIGTVPCASPTPTPTPPPQIRLRAEGRKVNGVDTVRLTWSGATSNQVDIYRCVQRVNECTPAVIATTANDGRYIDSTGHTGQAGFRYKVCEAGTQTCSRAAGVTFER